MNHPEKCVYCGRFIGHKEMDGDAVSFHSVSAGALRSSATIRRCLFQRIGKNGLSRKPRIESGFCDLLPLSQ